MTGRRRVGSSHSHASASKWDSCTLSRPAEHPSVMRPSATHNLEGVNIEAPAEELEEIQVGSIRPIPHAAKSFQAVVPSAGRRPRVTATVAGFARSI